MDPTAAIIAVTGLITTASSPLILSRLNARNQREASLRDQRTAVFTEATLYAQKVATFLDRITDPWYGASLRKGIPELPHTDAITARLRLLAPEHVRTAWHDLLSSEEALHFDVQENHPDRLIDEHEAVSSQDEFVVRLRDAVEKFYSATRDALGHPDR